MSEDPSVNSERFRAMAERIDRNSRNEFGGAALIIPPNKSGHEQPIELLMLDTNADPAQFLSTIMSRLQIMVREIEDRARLQQGYSR